MTWATTLPTREGWYWRRPVGGQYAAPVFVVDCEDTGRLECEDKPLKAGRHEWSDEPIAKPQEAR